MLNFEGINTVTQNMFDTDCKRYLKVKNRDQVLVYLYTQRYINSLIQNDKYRLFSNFLNINFDFSISQIRLSQVNNQLSFRVSDTKKNYRILKSTLDNFDLNWDSVDENGFITPRNSKGLAVIPCLDSSGNYYIRLSTFDLIDLTILSDTKCNVSRLNKIVFPPASGGGDNVSAGVRLPPAP